MTNKEKFIAELRAMNKLVKQDIKNNLPWVYSNTKKIKSDKTFDLCRKNNHRAANCVSGVQWALLRSGVVGPTREAIQWYGGKGNIVWLNSHAEADARKYFDIIEIKTKTVKRCIDSGILQSGDIVTYMATTHTNCYLGDNRWFDSGHANCTRQGEGAPFTQWIRTGTPYEQWKVGYILRLKAETYRVQVGAYSLRSNADKMKQRLDALKLSYFSEVERGMTYIYCGSYAVKELAEARQKELFDKYGVVSVLKEV